MCMQIDRESRKNTHLLLIMSGVTNLSSPKSLANLTSPSLGLLKPVFPSAIIQDRLSNLLFRGDHEWTVLPRHQAHLRCIPPLPIDSLVRRADREVHRLSRRSGCPRLPSSGVAQAGLRALPARMTRPGYDISGE